MGRLNGCGKEVIPTLLVVLASVSTLTTMVKARQMRGVIIWQVLLT